MMAKGRQRIMPDTSGAPFTFQIDLPATADAVRGALAMLRTRLAPLALSADDLGIVELVVAETLNNIVEHAFCEAGQSDVITIKGRYRGNGLHFYFADFGRPMPGLALPPTKTFDSACLMEHLPEGGFGWGLIKDLAQDIVYFRNGLMNTLSLRVPLEQR